MKTTAKTSWNFNNTTYTRAEFRIRNRRYVTIHRQAADHVAIELYSTDKGVETFICLVPAIRSLVRGDFQFAALEIWYPVNPVKGAA